MPIRIDGLATSAATKTAFATRATTTGSKVVCSRLQSFRTGSGSTRGIQVDQNLNVSMVGGIERQGIFALELDHQVAVKLDRIEGILGLLESKRVTCGRSPAVG